MKHTIIIAEAGVNHNGDIELAKKLIDIAADAGADYVKFQTFKASNLVTKKARKAEYQEKNLKEIEKTGQLEMLKKLELSNDDHIILQKHCILKNIKFLSTGFDHESLDFLSSIGVDLYKIPSGEITNLPYLRKVGAYGKNVILSSGMATLEEIRDAIEAITKSGTPKNNIVVLHCNTDYPTPFEDVNLQAMNSIGNNLGVKIGYSDHTNGIEVAIAATALGAMVVEKHFTIDKNLPGPDHKASLEPSELKAMVLGIRNIDNALGTATKTPSPSEKKNIGIVRKSIHLNTFLEAGAIISEVDLIMKRPAEGGISPMKIDSIIGKKVLKDLEADHQLRWEDFA